MTDFFQLTPLSCRLGTPEDIRLTFPGIVRYPWTPSDPNLRKIDSPLVKRGTQVAPEIIIPLGQISLEILARGSKLIVNIIHNINIIA